MLKHTKQMLDDIKSFDTTTATNGNDGYIDNNPVFLEDISRFRCNEIDWEERHFQIVLSLLRNNESPLWVIEKADTIVNLLKARHGTYEQ